MKLDKTSLYRYSMQEDILNAVSHGIAAVASYIGLIYLVYTAAKNGDVIDVLAFSFYGTSLIFLFLMSTLYHAIFHDMTRSIFKRLDHSAIFVLITGTYAPFTFSVIKTPLAYTIFAILVFLMFSGIIFKVFYIGKFKKTSTLIYVLMGWLVIFEIFDLVRLSSPGMILFLVLGGLAYTIGAIFYAFSNFKFHHFLWHLFVITAAVFQYIAVAFFIF